MPEKLASANLQRLLSQPIYSWEVSALLSSIVDHLEFSESHLAEQRRKEIHKAEEEARLLELAPQDAHLLPQAQAQIIDGVAYRFDIGLSQSVRYAGLIAYVSAVERCTQLFSLRLNLPVGKCPKKKSRSVHLLECLDNAIGNQLAPEIECFEKIVYIRNCIIHSAGVPKGYKHETEIFETINLLPGFRMTNDGLMEECICIEKGAIEILAQNALHWIPLLDEICTTKGILKQTL